MLTMNKTFTFRMARRAAIFEMVFIVASSKVLRVVIVDSIEFIDGVLNIFFQRLLMSV